jgi:hypothetical protein
VPAPVAHTLPLGAKGFDHARLLLHPELRRFSEIAVAAVARGSAALLQEALGPAPGAEALELTAFAASIQGVAPLLSMVEGVTLLPPELLGFLASERASSSARGMKLLTTLEETARALAADGVETIALKGAALLIRGDAEQGLRPMGDLDLLLVETGRMEAATRAFRALGWRIRFDTERHRVFARPEERVARPACEDPGNPIRIELHRHFRLPVLGRTYDATPALIAEAETSARAGKRTLVASGDGLHKHLLFHAAENFAAEGLRGVQVYDFRLLSQRYGPLRMTFSETDRRKGLAPLAYAAGAIERLFPGCFAPAFLDELRAEVPELLLSRAATLPSLRHTRPPLGTTRTALSLIESPGARARFFLRSLFPPLEEVKVNVVPDASGLALIAAWARLFFRRARRLVFG